MGSAAGIDVLLDAVDSTVHFSSVAGAMTEGTSLYDGFVVMASWLPDFINMQGLEEITERVKQSLDLEWNDVLPIVRETICSYDRRVYLVPVDMDMMYVHYREDLRIAAGLPVPNTWVQMTWRPRSRRMWRLDR